jgi:antibiotic biosynthesis monooxygenase (ABM) superfamily enzyme
MKKLLLTLLAATFLSLGVATATAADAAPKTVIHVVSVKWKADATPEQIKAALDGVHTLQKSYPGITRVWTNTIKKQGDWSAVFVMEFASEQALKDYANSPAQQEWYKLYTPIRERSNSHDVTN